MSTVQRLLAPNPGLLTGPGTNTYVIASEDECVVLDPGPVIDSHLAAIREALRGLQPKAVLVTHTHSDHAPLANPLASELDIRTYGYAAGPGFDPDRILRDGDRLPFGRATLQVLHTPGHTDDHLCFKLDDVLFTGDHIMGGSTVMVEDMITYLRSLQRIDDLRPTRLFPGHGHIIDHAGEVISRYMHHRMAREQEIARAVRRGARTVGAVVRSVYHEVHPDLHPAASVSVLAHLKKLEVDGLVDLASPGPQPPTVWNRRVNWKEPCS